VRFLADENFPLAAVRRLREVGHDVVAVAHDSPGIPDEEVLVLAAREERIVLTFDRDYGGLLFAADPEPPRPPSVVYFRLDPDPPEEPADLLLGLIEQTGDSVAHALTVVGRDRIRRRPLP
jgi:predicted nuclease of predicted toxin-antitoxin system